MGSVSCMSPDSLAELVYGITTRASGKPGAGCARVFASMKRYVIHSSAGDYPLLCGQGLLARRGWLARQLTAERTGVFVLSSPRVWRSCGRALAGSLAPERARLILFDDRETAKHLGTVERIARALVRAGADRGAAIVAAGGGVVGDVAGFAAASYMR